MKAAYESAIKNSDLDMAGVFAGETLDLINDIKPAKAIVEEIREDFDRETMRRQGRYERHS